MESDEEEEEDEDEDWSVAQSVTTDLVR
jgi:hypothetical protein